MNCHSLLSIVAIVAFAFEPTTASAQAAEVAPVAKPLPVRSLSFSRDGKLLAAAYGWNRGGELVVWQVEQRQTLFVLRDSKPISCAVFSPVADRIAFATSNNRIRVVSAASGETLNEWPGHDKRVFAVAYSTDGKRLASAGTDQSVKLWDAQSGELVKQFDCHAGEIRGVAISPDGRWLAAACGQDDLAVLWNLTKPEEAYKQFSVGGYAPRVAFSPDSKHLLIANYGNSVPAIHCATGKEAYVLTNVNSTRDVAVSTDGRWLALGGYSSQLPLFAWEPSANARRQREIDDLIAAFRSDDYSIREAASAKLLTFGRAAVEQLGAKLNSPDPEMRVRCRRLWRQLNDVESAEHLTGSELGTDCLAITPDSQRLAGGDHSGAIRLWNLNTQQLEATLQRDAEK